MYSLNNKIPEVYQEGIYKLMWTLRRLGVSPEYVTFYQAQNYTYKYKRSNL